MICAHHRSATCPAVVCNFRAGKHWARERAYVPVIELIRAAIGRYELAAVAGGWFASSEREGFEPSAANYRAKIA